MINNKQFEHLPIAQLMAIVRQDFRKLSDEGLIDEGTCVKTIMYCNEKLGIPLREVKQIVLPVKRRMAHLPLDFDKLYYAAQLGKHNDIKYIHQNPFDNNFDHDVIYDAELSREQLGGAENYKVVIKKITNMEVRKYDNWIELEVAPHSTGFCHIGSPCNSHKHGRRQIVINSDGSIECPFEEGELYLMYLGNMKDADGNLLFPFHPMITPWYEWCIKEKVVMDAIFNSDGNYGDLLKLAQMERTKAWIDAYNVTMEKGFGEYTALQRKRELQWYNQYFKNFQ